MNRTHTLAVVCLVATVCITSAPMGVVGHETPPPYPRLEPNDGFDRATEIAPRTLHGLAPIKFTNATGRPAIDPPPYWRPWNGDEDVYAVDLDRGDPLPVTLYHYGGDGNLRYTIYDPSGSEITTVDPDENWQRTGSSLVRSEKAIQRGQTTVTAQCTGTHYVRVESDDDVRAPYRIEVDDRFEHNENLSTAPTLTEGTYENLMVTTYDRDYYRLHVRKGEIVEATINLSTQAHWEWGPATKPVRVGDPVTDEEWAPYNHTRWAKASFPFEAYTGGPSQPGDFRIRAINQVKYDGLHRDKVSVDVTESGTMYLVVRPYHWWTSSIDGAARWNANSARYNITIRRRGTPSPRSQSPDSDDDSNSDPVRDALERVSAEAKNDDVGVAGTQFAGEVVNVHVRDRGVYSVEFGENLGVEAFSGCGRDDATLEVETDGETVSEIQESNEPLGRVGRAYRDGDVSVEGVGVVNTVKWGVIDRAVDVADWMSF